MNPNTPAEQEEIKKAIESGRSIEMSALSNEQQDGWITFVPDHHRLDFSAFRFRFKRYFETDPSTEEKILACLERIEKAILNGPHITIVPTPVYPPTLPPTYFGDPHPGPIWPNTPTITCNTLPAYNGFNTITNKPEVQ